MYLFFSHLRDRMIFSEHPKSRQGRSSSRVAEAVAPDTLPQRGLRSYGPRCGVEIRLDEKVGAPGD
jgi:hypothetical protein